jgi:hypothetical protein
MKEPMDVNKANSHTMLKRVVAPLTVWAVTKALEAPRVRKAMSDVDRRFHKKRKAAGKNAMKNRVWLAAGIAALLTGVGMMAKATQK